ITSARRFKKDIVDMHYGLAEILQMQGKEYVYVNDPTSRHEIGLIAEEVELVVPELVYHNPKDNLVFGIDYGKLTPVLIEAIKEQQQKIDHQTHLIADQQQQIDELRILVKKLLDE
ncbi:MAG TPA: tail fiber domain-containing protein, partial [Saprospiraceae bacterium]|nr:tail fiber domain-containing protein [Saprospiraceae bacterium]